VRSGHRNWQDRKLDRRGALASRWFRPARQCIVAILVTSVIQPSVGVGADRTDIATSVLELGGTVGKLVWDTVDNRSKVSEHEANQYIKLAAHLKDQIDAGRASSSILKANFNMLGTTLAYAATVDPEPLSKAVTGVAAWGAKKGGDALGQMIVDKTQDEARAILAQGLKNSGLSQTQLKAMSAIELSARVADLKVGGKTLREILKDDPRSMGMLQAHATDIATDIGVAALAKAEGTSADVKTIQRDLARTTNEIDKYQKQVKTQLTNMESRVSGLEDATRAANEKLGRLKEEVKGNSKAIQTLAHVSYPGWSTAQKLQAVNTGLFPDLTPTQKRALTESLEADKAREEAVADIQRVSKDLGSLRQIAVNLGLDGNLVKGLGDAQKVATGIAQFATGDYLGAIATVTSLAGLGTQDAAAARHEAMMKYLNREFEKVNEKLNQIIDLQVKTIKAVIALGEEQRKFRIEVLNQLDRIEDTVLRSERILQSIVRNEWVECDALISGTVLNRQYDIPTRQILVGVITDADTPKNVAACYSRMINFLQARVKPADWDATVIDASNFPDKTIASDPPLQQALVAFQKEHLAAYKSARDFVLLDLGEANDSPAAYLARFAQPVVATKFANELDSALAKKEIKARFHSFKCNQIDILAPAIRELACVGRADADRNPDPPRVGRWRQLLDASLIGPWSTRLIDIGITLSTIVDFGQRDDSSGAFTFVNSGAIEGFSRDGPTPELRKALQQQKGLKLLKELAWLTEATVMQQSIAYGDYTAQLVEKVLYGKGYLDGDPKDRLTQLALAAMRTNPILARNVILLAMRHAIRETLGGPVRAASLNYKETYYSLGLLDFATPLGCDGSKEYSRKLRELFPKWRFEYRVTKEQKEKGWDKCPTEVLADSTGSTPQLALGSGVSIKIADFYVLVPSPLELSEGVFQEPESLRAALANRDRVSQAIIDRNVAAAVKELAGGGNDSRAVSARIAFRLLNDGWGWKTRTKSP
jgi:hypothetical protein